MALSLILCHHDAHLACKNDNLLLLFMRISSQCPLQTSQDIDKYRTTKNVGHQKISDIDKYRTASS